jgi:hypothetical protein
MASTKGVVRHEGRNMKKHSRILKLGLAALMTAGLLAAPGMAGAQSYRQGKSNTRTEDSARNNAIALGAAGVILMNNGQKTLGTIALGAAVQQTLKMQDSIKERHDREDDRYGYNRYEDRYGNYRYGSNNRYDSNRYDAYRYGSSHYSSGRFNKGHYKNDDCEDDDHRGKDWAASRGKKKGWDKNGKRH